MAKVRIHIGKKLSKRLKKKWHIEFFRFYIFQSIKSESSFNLLQNIKFLAFYVKFIKD